MSASASEAFRKKFDEYNGIHKNLKGKPLKDFNENFSSLGVKINEATELKPTDITTAVEKKEALDQLKPKLRDLTTEYSKIRDDITLNNANLEALKVRITEAIAAKTVAAAAKAAQDASTAAQALAVARQAVQTQIDALNVVIGERNEAFKQELTSKTTHVRHMVQPVIPNKVDGIKGLLLQGEHISQETKDMVEGIEKDITTFISRVDFESIATPFKDKHETEIAGIQSQIGELTKAMSGGDINAMQSALASNPIPLSATLGDFIGAANAFIGTLGTKLGELDGAEARVKAAIQVDKDKDIAVKRDIEVLLEHANKVDDSDKLFVNKLDEADKIVVTSPSFNTRLGTVLGNAITTLTPFGREVEKINSRFEQMNATMNASYKSSDNYLALKKTIDGLNELYKAQQSKYDALNAKYTNYKAAVATPPSTLRPSIVAPRRFPPPAATPGRASPQEGWNKEQPLNPIPIDYEQPDAADADPESEPVTPPAPIIGARRNFLYVSHNTKPKTAYLVVVKKQRLDDSQGQDGGNKNYHVQKGGAPPVRLPEGSEIFTIDTDNPNFLDVMVGLLPPSFLLKVNPDGTGENPIITNIRRGRRPKEGLDALYQQIRRELITDENQNPLTIGLRAVYYQNIIKLIRLLDFNLNPGRRVHQEMYENLRKFMDFTYGTFGVLEALFDATFKRNPISPRPNTPQDPPPKIDAVFNKKQIKKIVGWKSNIENTHFRMLFNIFSIKCPNGIKNTFLTDDEPFTQKNLGSKKPSYNQFRLNWIILLAFHTLYIGNTKSETVGELIKALYDAFLGWMTMATHKDTFYRMFRNTLVRQTPAQAYSDQVAKRINDINGNDPTLQPLVKAIKDKLCELQSNHVNPVNPVNHDDEYDEYENDPEYVPPEGGDSDSSSARSDDAREAGEDLEVLSPPGFSPRPDGARTRRDRRNPKIQGPTTAYSQGTTSVLPPPGDPPRHDDTENDDDDSDVEPILDPPPRPTLMSPEDLYQGSPQSTNRYRDNQPVRVRVSSDWIKQSAAAAAERPRHPQLPDIGLYSGSEDDSFPDVHGNPAGQGDIRRPTFLHPARSTTPGKRAIPAGLKPPSASPKPGVFNRQQRPSSARSSLGSTGALQGSNPGSYTDRGPRSTQLYPIKDATNPDHEKQNRQLRPGGFASLFARKHRVSPEGGVGKGGSHKKRTRKHKKHPSISASRRPTRRRRIPPTEGHKYTRKRPRT